MLIPLVASVRTNGWTKGTMPLTHPWFLAVALAAANQWSRERLLISTATWFPLRWRHRPRSPQRTRCRLRKSFSPSILLLLAEKRLSSKGIHRKNRSNRQLPWRPRAMTICLKTVLHGPRLPHRTTCPKAPSWCSARARQSASVSLSVGKSMISPTRRSEGGCWKREGRVCSGHQGSEVRWEGRSAMGSEGLTGL